MNILNSIWNYIIGAWFILCGVTNNANRQLHNFVIAEIIVCSTILGLFIIGFATDCQVLVVLSGGLAAIVVFFSWKITSVGVGIISALAKIIGKTPIVGKAAEETIEATNEELRKLLYPMLIVSLACSFVAALAAIRGPGWYTWKDIMVQSTMLLFMIIFIYWLDCKTKIAGWVMICVLCYFWLVYYCYPIQGIALVTKVDRCTVRLSILSSDGNKNDELVSIAANIPLFEKSKGKFTEVKITNRTNVMAKVISQSVDPKSREPMYFVVLPTAPNLYVGGMEVFVPARMVEITSNPKVEKNSTSTTITLDGSPVHLTLKAGEEWGTATIPLGIQYDFFSCPSAKYKIVLPDKREFQKGEPWPEFRTFKIVALCDSEIDLKKKV